MVLYYSQNHSTQIYHVLLTSTHGGGGGNMLIPFVNQKTGSKKLKLVHSHQISKRCK